MTTPSDLVDHYLADPTPATLAELRRAVRSARGFRPDLEVHGAVQPLLERGSYAEAVVTVQELMPGALFSPSAHAVLAEALTGAGEPDAARREVALARAALGSIRSTGDGTRARPWSVLRLSDEYDVLRDLKTTSREQTVVQDGERHLDRHVCADGREVYFDVTDLFPRS